MVTHNRHLQSSDPLLGELTRLYGVQTSYRDSRGRWRESPVESVAQVLRALGAELGDGDAADPLRGVTPARMAAAVQERKRQIWSRVLEPVDCGLGGEAAADHGAAAGGGGASRRAGVPGTRVAGAKLTLILEDGGLRSRDLDLNSLRIAEAVTSGRQRFQAYRLLESHFRGAGRESARLPWGYHRLRIEIGKMTAEATVLAAPRRCWEPEWALGCDSAMGGPVAVGTAISGPATRGSWRGVLGASESSREWGVFAPLYALRSERNWGAGDLADLEKLRELGRRRGRDRGGHAASARQLSGLSLRACSLSSGQSPVLERVLPGRRPDPGMGTLRGRPRAVGLQRDAGIGYEPFERRLWSTIGRSWLSSGGCWRS